MTVRILIADDHPVIADALEVGVGQHGIEVVGRTTVASQVLPQYEALRPDVLVLDVSFSGTKVSGLDIAHKLLAVHPEARIVVFSQHDTDDLIREAYRLGASTFLPKSTPTSDVVNAILRVCEQGDYFLPSIAERLARLATKADSTPQTLPAQFPAAMPEPPARAMPEQAAQAVSGQSPQTLLDRRELEVFRLVALGHETADIAGRMGLAPRTVTEARQAIRRKLREDNPVRLALLAIQAGVISADDLPPSPREQ